MPKELKCSERPPAVAYIRLDEDDDHVFAGLLKDIATCCLREGLRLVQTFTDRRDDGSQLARPGIAELQAALKDTVGLTVVVPTPSHLSPSDVIRGPLLLMISNLGGRLIVARELNDCPDETGTTAYRVELDDADEVSPDDAEGRLS